MTFRRPFVSEYFKRIIFSLGELGKTSLFSLSDQKSLI